MIGKIKKLLIDHRSQTVPTKQVDIWVVDELTQQVLDCGRLKKDWKGSNDQQGMHNYMKKVARVKEFYCGIGNFFFFFKERALTHL